MKKTATNLQKRWENKKGLIAQERYGHPNEQISQQTLLTKERTPCLTPSTSFHATHTPRQPELL